MCVMMRTTAAAAAVATSRQRVDQLVNFIHFALS